MPDSIEAIVSHLIQKSSVGNCCTNGPQTISYSPETDTGYLFCDDPNCCNLSFSSIDEIKSYIENDHSNDWRIQ